MASEQNGRMLRDTLRHLTEEEHRIFQGVLQRRPFPRDTKSPAGEPLTFGQRLADTVTDRIGSWPFIIVQSVILLIWIIVNTIAWRQHWDPYPFILLNLVLSFQAAYAAPIIMMSQNRQTAKDREKAEADYAVDRQAEIDIAVVHTRLDELTGQQWAALVDLQRQQLELLGRIEALTREVHRVTIQQDSSPEAAQMAPDPFPDARRTDQG